MSLRTFCLAFFKHCPLLAQFTPEEHVAAFENFILYKQRVPVRGVILLNPEMDSTILVKGWKKGSSWSFPRGKIAKDEPDVVCAIREAWEETGLDVRAAGLIPDGTEPKSIDITMKDSEIRLFVIRNVPMDTHFEPQTRKEISKIQWFKLSELPSFKKKGAQNKSQQQPDATPNVNKFFMVAPFVNPLKRWISTQKKIDAKKHAGIMYMNPSAAVEEDTVDSDYYPHQHAPEQPLAPEYAQQPANRQQPMQILQKPVTSSDKASALLSMLQPKAPDASVLQYRNMPHEQIPHTPQELTGAEPPQPGNPHHHSIQPQGAVHASQPPPQFHLDQQGQPPPYNYYQQPEQRQAALLKENAFHQQQTPQANLRQVHASQAPLVHPQPQPPQVQRAVFNQSAFQEKSPNMPNTKIPQQPQIQQYQQPHSQRMQQPRNAQQTYGQPPAQPQQGQLRPDNGRTVQLNGQSMALLNAFKKETGPSPSAEAAQPVQQQLLPQQPPLQDQYGHYNLAHSAPQHIPQPRQQQIQLSPAQAQVPSHYTHYNQQPPSAQVGPQLSELSASVEQKPAQRPSFSGPGPSDQQRSALLDMFKKQPGPQAQKVPTPGSQTGSGMEQQLLDTLRRVPAEAAAPKLAPQPAPQTIAKPPPQQTSSLSDLLAFRPRPEQANASKPRDHLAAPSALQPQHHQQPSNQHTIQRQPSSNGNSGPQPIRILPRGQGLDTFSGAQHPPKPPSQTSPYSNPSLPRTGSYASPPIAPSQPSPALSHGQPQASSDQKNRLLSLFGKQQQPQQKQSVGNSASPSVTEAGMELGSGTPARPGSSTPMSPAEQTFLLDYLQSVTTGAKR